jgi:hypothetical protein
VLSVLFLLTLFSQNLFTHENANGQPGLERITHSQDHLVDIAVQPGKHSTEKPGVEPSEILDHTFAVSTAHFDSGFLTFSASPLLSSYLVYTQTTASRL